ncbi:MAG: acyltransferase [Promethearchaeia archaeon]
MMSKPNKEHNTKDVIKDLESIDISRIPITTNAFSWSKTAVVLNILLHSFSLLIPSVFILTFFNDALNTNLYQNWWRALIIIVDVFAWWGFYILTSLVMGKLVLILLELIHRPKEGLFKMDLSNHDYYFYCLRISVKKFIFWIWNNFCFPWVSNFAYKVCGMKADFKSTMFDGWSDLEFVEFGDNIMLGQGGVVLSSMALGDYLLIKKVVIGDHVVIGGNAIVAPGTIIGEGATLGVWASTHIGQYLEPNWIYIGRPAKKYKHARKSYEESKKQAYRRIVDEGRREEFEVNRIVKKGQVEIVLDKLDEMYQEWKEEQIKKARKRDPEE